MAPPFGGGGVGAAMPALTVFALVLVLPVLVASPALASAGRGEVDPTGEVSDADEESGSAAVPAAPEKIELNGATAEELASLPGLGPKKAEAIIAHRLKRPFTRVTQLLEIRGIGRKTLERLRPLVSVAPLKKVKKEEKEKKQKKAVRKRPTAPSISDAVVGSEDEGAQVQGADGVGRDDASPAGLAAESTRGRRGCGPERAAEARVAVGGG